ncbi:MAG: hypothetical protein K2J06_02725 [Muribaculaceae bacterium]|nr:hypothetical protein [Muribaculaceae bacterium]
MKLLHKIFLLLIISVNATQFINAGSIRYYRPGEKFEYDSIQYMVKDPSFETSYEKLSKMFNGEIPYNLKDAEFLVENAYYGGTVDYKQYCHDIDSVVRVLRMFIKINNLEQYKTAPNFAIFDYMTKSSIMNGNSKFTYDFDNPMGLKDFSILFTSHLLRTHKGQCISMPLLYKILCDELGGHSALAFAPMHLYIKHIGEDGKWYNIELTNGGFARDEWMIENMGISTESIRNGIFLCALSEKETIGFMLMQLSRAYQSKYNSYDYFIERNVNEVLSQFPNFCDALVLKFNLYQYRGIQFQQKFGYEKTPYQDMIYLHFKETMDKLDLLGYSQPTPEEYNEIIEEGRRIMEGGER